MSNTRGIVKEVVADSYKQIKKKFNRKIIKLIIKPGQQKLQESAIKSYFDDNRNKITPYDHDEKHQNCRSTDQPKLYKNAIDKIYVRIHF